MARVTSCPSRATLDRRSLSRLAGVQRLVRNASVVLTAQTARSLTGFRVFFLSPTRRGSGWEWRGPRDLGLPRLDLPDELGPGPFHHDPEHLTHPEQQDIFCYLRLRWRSQSSYFVISEKNAESFRTSSEVPGGADRVRRSSNDAPFRVGRTTLSGVCIDAPLLD